MENKQIAVLKLPKEDLGIFLPKDAEVKDIRFDWDTESLEIKFGSVLCPRTPPGTPVVYFNRFGLEMLIKEMEVEGDRDSPVIGLRTGPLLKKVAPDEPIRCGIRNLCEYKCVVLPDPVEEITAGGIAKPRSVTEKEKHTICKATFIIKSENAFRDWGGYAPEPGDRIYVSVMSGMIHKGPDGREYRIVNDKDVVGQLDE